MTFTKHGFGQVLPDPQGETDPEAPVEAPAKDDDAAVTDD
jgi:hypothetical protein